MSEWEKVKIGDFLTESKIIAIESNAAHRITVRLNCKGVEQRSLKAEKEGATKYYTRKSGQFIYGKQNIHKGAFGIIPQELDGFTSSADLPAFDVDLSKCIPEWICICLQKDEYYKTLQKNVKGVGSQRLAVNVFLDSEIPLPPVEKQVEIIKKIKLQLQKTEQLSVEIESQKNYIKQLRQNILQEAIEGKLTADWRKQNPVQKGNPDYDAEALFEQIQKEKYHTDSILLTQNQDKKKKGKSLDFPNPCDNEEKPFAIPDGWKWVRLGEIIDSIVYGTSEKCSYDDRQNSAILRIPNISSGIIDATDLKYTNLSKTEKNELSLRENDVLVIRSNGSPEIVGKMVNVPKDYENYCYAGYLIRLRFTIPEIGLFIAKISSTNNLRKQIEEPLRTTVGINNINSDEIKALRFPLPSLEEQKEIVTRIEKHLQSVSDLENQITEREQLTKQLMQSILKDAFEEN